MRRVAMVLLPTVLTVVAAADAPAQDTQFRARLALHVAPRSIKSQCSYNSPVAIPCVQFDTEGDLRTSYDLYVIVTNGAAPGIGGATFSIGYDDAPGSGIDILESRPPSGTSMSSLTARTTS